MNSLKDQFGLGEESYAGSLFDSRHVYSMRFLFLITTGLDLPGHLLFALFLQYQKRNLLFGLHANELLRIETDRD